MYAGAGSGTGLPNSTQASRITALSPRHTQYDCTIDGRSIDTSRHFFNKQVRARACSSLIPLLLLRLLAWPTRTQAPYRAAAIRSICLIGASAFSCRVACVAAPAVGDGEWDTQVQAKNKRGLGCWQRLGGVEVAPPQAGHGPSGDGAAAPNKKPDGFFPTYQCLKSHPWADRTCCMGVWLSSWAALHAGPPGCPKPGAGRQ